MKIIETLGLQKKWRLLKWGKIPQEATEFLQRGGSIEETIRRFGLKPEVVTWEGNVGLNEGLALLLDLLIGAGGTTFNNANANIGVGDSSTAENPTQTGLLGTNKLYKAMDATYPQRTSQTVEWRSTFGTSDANFAWQEYTVANGNSDVAINLNRKVASKGTKVSGETWTLSLQATAA